MKSILTASNNINNTIAKNLSATQWSFSYEKSAASKKSLTINFLKDVKQVVPTNYTIALSASGTTKKMQSIESQQTYNVKIVDTQGNKLSSDHNATLKVELLNKIANIIEINQTPKYTLQATASSVSFVLQSYKKSGTIPLKVTATYYDTNTKSMQTLTQIYTIVIFSGPATAMSINLIDTQVSQDYAGFKSRFEIKLNDKYGNVHYAIGHNYRQIIGTAQEAIARVASEDGNYTIKRALKEFR